jgi:hypothetical protein
VLKEKIRVVNGLIELKELKNGLNRLIELKE